MIPLYLQDIWKIKTEKDNSSHQHDEDVNLEIEVIQPPFEFLPSDFDNYFNESEANGQPNPSGDQSFYEYPASDYGDYYQQETIDLSQNFNYFQPFDDEGLPISPEYYETFQQSDSDGPQDDGSYNFLQIPIEIPSDETASDQELIEAIYNEVKNENDGQNDYSYHSGTGYIPPQYSSYNYQYYDYYSPDYYSYYNDYNPLPGYVPPETSSTFPTVFDTTKSSTTKKSTTRKMHGNEKYSRRKYPICNSIRGRSNQTENVRIRQ